MNSTFPPAITRRHFSQHLAGLATWACSASALTHSLRVHAADLNRRRKAAILLWMGGGPSTIDIWDLKPGAATGGEFRPIATAGEMQICEHLPKLAQRMDRLSVVRSMNTREADHGRGRYYMHTGYVPDPSLQHPSYGSVVAKMLAEQRPALAIPPFVSIGGNSVGPGFLGMAWAPYVAESNGRIKNLDMQVGGVRMNERLRMLDLIENQFILQSRGPAATDHRDVLQKTRSLLTSRQMDAFKYQQERPQVIDRYGDSSFGRGCLMARRLVEVGVPFVEVDFGGWDNHREVFSTLSNDKLPVMDQAMSALMDDLVQRGMWEDTAVIWMGEFGRTPSINSNGGRDHFARAWSVVVGGAGFQGGLAVGETSPDGTEVSTKSYRAEDLMASVCQALEIDLETKFVTGSGRPMKIANKGLPIPELFS